MSRLGSAPSASPAPAAAEVQQSIRPDWRPTWWVLLASATALVALCNIDPARRPVAPLMLIPVIAGSYILPYRLRREGPVRWVIRISLFLIVLLLAPERSQATRVWYLDQSIMATAGLMAGIELTLQHWMREVRHGVLLWLSAGIMVCASSTFEHDVMSYLAPVYALSAIGVIRVFRPERQTAARTSLLRGRWRPALVKGSAVVLAMLLGLTLTVAVQRTREALNRIGASWLPRFAPSQAIGMGSTSQLSSHYNLYPSTVRALRILNSTTPRHLRGMVFDEYVDGGAWIPRFERRIFDDTPPILMLPPREPAVRIIRLQDNLSLLYVPLSVSRIGLDMRTAGRMERGHRGVLTAIAEAGGTCTYTIEPQDSVVAQGPLCRPLSAEERQACLEIPSNLSEETSRIVPTLGDAPPQKMVQLIVRYLQQNHQYTLETRMGAGDPLKDFLATPGRKAHCQFFASAAVMLMRAKGIPARYITGYYAHEPFGDRELVVRQRDAHAWAEAWIDGVGWITVDATPAGGTPAELYGQVSVFQRWREKLTDLFSTALDWLKQIEWRVIALFGVGLVLLALMIQSLLVALRRRRKPQTRGYSFPGEELREICTEFSRVLRSVGEAPLESATWSEHLVTQAAQTPSRRSRRHLRLKAAADFVAVYNRIRFGDPDNPAALSELRRHLKSLKESAI